MYNERLAILGNPENRRVTLFQEALVRSGSVPARIVSYSDLLSGKQEVSSLFAPGALLRIESPGENSEVENLLVCKGMGGRVREAMQPSFGEIWKPRLWMRGFSEFLHDIAYELKTFNEKHRATCSTVQNCPRDIAVMFDKTECSRRLAAAGVPVPESLAPPGSFEEFLRAMETAGWRRAFVKLRSGSSASSIVAFERSKHRMQAWTTMELVRTEDGRYRFYNRLKVRRLTCPSTIAAMIDFICCEGAHVEMWVPKGSLQGFVFDARVLVIAGRPAHRILRLSRTPLTNLHLGNRRASFDLLRPEIQEAVLSAATRAAGCFPNSLVCGVDVLWNRGSFGARVVEVNAFGDLLPGLLFEGMGAYDAIVRQLLKGGAAYAEHA